MVEGVTLSYRIWVGKKVLLLMGKEWDFCKGLWWISPGATLQGGLLGVAHSTYTRTGLTDACARTEKENERRGEKRKKNINMQAIKKRENKEK